MGTRGLTAVMLGGEYKVAQYGQWDHYPDGQGVDVLEFCKSVDMGVFREKVSQLSWATLEEVKALWVECGASPDDEWVTLDISAKFGEKYPYLSRDAGAKVLSHIYNSEAPLKLQDSIGFAGSSLFCEWAYVIDLDKNTFEVYRGFNKEPLDEGERFFGAEVEERSTYTPIRHLRTWALNDLPSKSFFVEELNKLAYPEDED